MKTTFHRQNGFTLVELMIVIAILGLLVAIATPNFIRSRASAQKNLCINNLRVIADAKESWGFDHKLSTGVRANQTQINAYIHGGVMPKCPGSGAYRYRPFGMDPSCSVEGHELGSLFGTDSGEDEL